MKRENVIIGALMGLVALLVLSALTFQIALMTGRPDTIFNLPEQAALLLAPATAVPPTVAPQAAAVVVSTPAPTTPTATAIALPTVPVVPVVTTTSIPTPETVLEDASEEAPVVAPTTITAGPSSVVQQETAPIVFQAEAALHNVNDSLLVGIIQSSPYAIGFMSNASYLPNQDLLRVVKLQTDDGRFVEPESANLTDRTYPLTRPLFLYTSETTLQRKPEVASFISCYLNHVTEEVNQVGYAPINSQAFAQGIINFQAANNTADSRQLLDCVPADAPANNIIVSGSSAIAPLNQRIGNLFVQDGFQGQVYVNPSDTEAGFSQYCEEGTGGDIVGAGRLIRDDELENCRLLNRNPIMFPVAVDALSVVVSRQNTFVEQLTMEQLRTLFTDAALWSDVDPAWPEEPIIRAIPSTTSDSFDFFAKSLFGDVKVELAITSNTQSINSSVALSGRATLPPPDAGTSTEGGQASTAAGSADDTEAPTEPPTASTDDTPDVEEPPADFDYIFATIDNHPQCQLATEVVVSVLRDWGWSIGESTAVDTAELFAQLTVEETSDTQAANLTLCYTDPDDRGLFRSVERIPQLIGRGYAENDTTKLYVMARPGIPNEIELTDRCIWNFMRGLSFGDTLQAGQSPAEWFSQNPDILEAWGSCQGQYRIGVLN